MRTQPMRDRAAFALIALVACNGDGLHISAPADLAPPPDQVASCIGLPECTCLDRSDCTPLSTPCWCPSWCIHDLVCICGGGHFLGCAPASSHCPTQPCGVAHPVVGPDARGCFSCGPLTCAAGKASLIANCGFGSGWLDGLSCARKQECIAGCMAALDLTAGGDILCTDVGCSFCSTCDCAGVTAFGACVADCLK